MSNNDDNQINMKSNNNKNNKGLIIGLIVAGVILFIVVGMFIWNKYVDYKYQETDDEIKDSINDIDDIDHVDDVTDNNQNNNQDNNQSRVSSNIYYYGMLGEIQNKKISLKEYNSVTNYTECTKKYNFSIDNGILTVSDLKNNTKYSLKKITNIKALETVSYAYSCDLEVYYLLTNDGKIYQTIDTFYELTYKSSDISKIDDYFVLMDTSNNLSFSDIGYVLYRIDDQNPDASVGLIAKTADNDEIIFTNSKYDKYGFYKVVE